MIKTTQPPLHGEQHCPDGSDPIPCMVAAPGVAGDYEAAVLALSDNLIAYWRLGEPAGPWEDSYGIYDLTLAGLGTAPTPDVTGALTLGDDGAVEFNYDGSSSAGGKYLSYPTTTNTFRDLNAKTIAGWVKLKASALTRYGSIIGTRADAGGSSPGWALQVVYPTLDIAFAHGNTPNLVTTTGGVAAGQWVFVALTDDTTTTSLYINATLVDTYAGGGIAVGGNASILLGRTERSGTVDFFYGTSDEMAVWGRALTAAEVSGLYAAGLSDFETGDVPISDGTGGVTWGKITTASIEDGTIVDADIDPAAAITVSKMAPGTDGQILTTSGGTTVWADPAGGGASPSDTYAWLPLSTVAGGVPDLVWDASDNLIPTFTPI